MFKIKQFNQPLISVDLAFFFLRIALGALIFINHGIEKIFTFNAMLAIFPDPIGIGKFPGLIFALATDGICSILIIFGLFTRISTLLLSINLLVAFVFFHKLQITDVHGELVAIYLAVTLLLFIFGPGNISIDKLIKNKFSE
ncbi:DoxX family protein [Flavobacterium cupreum]|uniref:DoxX family protein n=1 Tax=Flavobacterium cupreum TaxID=2133766 RepID=A0A434ADL3_9FLAO|nr:DoxX family protein [Flavobacterium cupreum]RUT72444.1 DoxX family protein [Flavobacterium cupreum]